MNSELKKSAACALSAALLHGAVQPAFCQSVVRFQTAPLAPCAALAPVRISAPGLSLPALNSPARPISAKRSPRARGGVSPAFSSRPKGRAAASALKSAGLAVKAAARVFDGGMGIGVVDGVQARGSAGVEGPSRLSRPGKAGRLMAAAAVPGLLATAGAAPILPWLQWALSPSVLALWLPFAAVLAGLAVGALAPKPQEVGKTFLKVKLKAMEEIGDEVRKSLALKVDDEDADLSGHDEIVENGMEALGYEQLFVKDGWRILSIPDEMTPEMAQENLMSLGVVSEASAFSLPLPERPIEARWALSIPVSAAVFVSGLLLDHFWAGLFSAGVLWGASWTSMRNNRTLSGVVIPQLAALVPAVFGMATGSPIAAVFHSSVIAGIFGYLAHGNTFASFFEGKALDLDRPSLLVTIGVPLAALSVASMWADWALTGFFGLAALGWAIEKGLSKAVGTEDPGPLIEINISSGEEESEVQPAPRRPSDPLADRLQKKDRALFNKIIIAGVLAAVAAAANPVAWGVHWQIVSGALFAVSLIALAFMAAFIVRKNAVNRQLQDRLSALMREAMLAELDVVLGRRG